MVQDGERVLLEVVRASGRGWQAGGGGRLRHVVAVSASGLTAEQVARIGAMGSAVLSRLWGPAGARLVIGYGRIAGPAPPDLTLVGSSTVRLLAAADPWLVAGAACAVVMARRLRRREDEVLTVALRASLRCVPWVTLRATAEAMRVVRGAGR